ncbi:MAG: hypothetical protein EBZ77_15560, partial [Chitinophagia bacterium]|nr:hypothetical protein [Chitinophagia bacterium]
ARWNAYISHKFLKNNQLTVQAAVYDLLNQNLGYNRESENGIITESRYNTIRRYGMLNVIWNFTRAPGGGGPVNTDDE